MNLFFFFFHTSQLMYLFTFKMFIGSLLWVMHCNKAPELSGWFLFSALWRCLIQAAADEARGLCGKHGRASGWEPLTHSLPRGILFYYLLLKYGKTSWKSCHVTMWCWDGGEGSTEKEYVLEKVKVKIRKPKVWAKRPHSKGRTDDNQI